MARCRFTLNNCIAGYHGIAESVYWERRRGMVVMAVLLVLSLVQAFVAMGGTNGFGTYGTDRMAAARSLYDHTVGALWCCIVAAQAHLLCTGHFCPSTRGLGIVGYWSAMIAIESIVWLGVAAWGGYTFFKLLQVRAFVQRGYHDRLCRLAHICPMQPNMYTVLTLRPSAMEMPHTPPHTCEV